MTINLEIFQKNLTYEATAPVANILADLNEIDSLKITAGIKQKQFRSLLIWFIAGAVLSAFLVIVLVGMVTLPCFIAAAIYAWGRLKKYRRLNIPSQRYNLLKQVLSMLERDIEKGADVSVCLVLSSSTRKEKVTQTVSHSTLRNFKIDYYRDEWLKIQGKFIDKTRFLVTTTELNQTKYGWKRSRSGKSKYKSKTKFQGLDIGVTLTYPPKRYGAVKIFQNQVREAVKLPESAGIKRIKVTDKDLELIVNVAKMVEQEQETLYKTITMMLLSLYQVLNLARMLSKK